MPASKTVHKLLNLDLNLDLSIVPASALKEIETIVSPYTPRPLATKVKYDENKFYNFLIFDTETNTTGKSAELCQLSATDQTGLYQFSTYTLPVHDIDHFASKVNKLKIVKVSGERKLYKDNKEVSTLPLKEAMSQFLGFVSRSVERAKSRTNKNVVTVLLGNNSLTFDKQSFFCRNLLIASDRGITCVGVGLTWMRRTSLHLQHDLTRTPCYQLVLRGVCLRLSTL